MNSARSQLSPDPGKLKPLLHEKIEQMNAHQLSLLNKVLLQVEAEELADRLNDVFDADAEKGKFLRISEQIREYRVAHRSE